MSGTGRGGEGKGRPKESGLERMGWRDDGGDGTGREVKEREWRCVFGGETGERGSDANSEITRRAVLNKKS